MYRRENDKMIHRKENCGLKCRCGSNYIYIKEAGIGHICKSRFKQICKKYIGGNYK